MDIDSCVTRSLKWMMEEKAKRCSALYIYSKSPDCITPTHKPLIRVCRTPSPYSNPKSGHVLSVCAVSACYWVEMRGLCD